MNVLSTYHDPCTIMVPPFARGNDEALTDDLGERNAGGGKPDRFVTKINRTLKKKKKKNLVKDGIRMKWCSRENMKVNLTSTGSLSLL